MPAPDHRHHSEQCAAPRIPWWLWPHVLSLEAPAVAVLWQAVLARTHRVTLLPAAAAGLALAAWLIYVADRLLDGTADVRAAADVRHAFYRRHRRVFAWIILPLAAAALAWIALWRLPEGLMWHGLALALLVLIYLGCYAARRHRRLVGAAGGALGFAAVTAIFFLPMPVGSKLQLTMAGVLLMVLGFARRDEFRAGGRLPKELAGSLLFALGCAAGVQFYSMSEGVAAMSADLALLWVIFALNMFGIAAAEQAGGAGDDGSAAVLWPRLGRWYPLLLGAGIAGCAGVVFAADSLPARTGRLAAAAGAALLLLALVWLARHRLSPSSCRVLADLALAVPALVLLCL